MNGWKIICSESDIKMHLPNKNEHCELDKLETRARELSSA